MIRFFRNVTTAAAIALAVTVTAGCSQPPPAQSQAQPAQRGARFGKMLATLNLSDAQKSEIRSIMASARKANESVTDLQVKRANMRAAFAKVQTVLTPAQHAQLEAEIQQARTDGDGANHS
jgi:Spy/CpxP family protein refolding chaperone